METRVINFRRDTVSVSWRCWALIIHMWMKRAETEKGFSDARYL